MWITIFFILFFYILYLKDFEYIWLHMAKVTTFTMNEKAYRIHSSLKRKTTTSKWVEMRPAAEL